MSATHLLCVSKWSLELNQLCPTAWLQSWMHCVFLNPRAINKRHLWHFFFLSFFPHFPMFKRTHTLDNSFHEFSLSHWHSLQNEASHSSSLSTRLFLSLPTWRRISQEAKPCTVLSKEKPVVSLPQTDHHGNLTFFFPLRNSSLRSH